MRHGSIRRCWVFWHVGNKHRRPAWGFLAFKSVIVYANYTFLSSNSCVTTKLEHSVCCANLKVANNIAQAMLNTTCGAVTFGTLCLSRRLGHKIHIDAARRLAYDEGFSGNHFDATQYNHTEHTQMFSLSQAHLPDASMSVGMCVIVLHGIEFGLFAAGVGVRAATAATTTTTSTTTTTRTFIAWVQSLCLHPCFKSARVSLAAASYTCHHAQVANSSLMLSCMLLFEECGHAIPDDIQVGPRDPEVRPAARDHGAWAD